jgi:hypothetical protein
VALGVLLAQMPFNYLGVMLRQILRVAAHGLHLSIQGNCPGVDNLRSMAEERASANQQIGFWSVSSLSLNSHVPLPRFIYRLFFWDDVTRLVDIFEP